MSIGNVHAADPRGQAPGRSLTVPGLGRAVRLTLFPGQSSRDVYWSLAVEKWQSGERSYTSVAHGRLQTEGELLSEDDFWVAVLALWESRADL